MAQTGWTSASLDDAERVARAIAARARITTLISNEHERRFHLRYPATLFWTLFHPRVCRTEMQLLAQPGGVKVTIRTRMGTATWCVVLTSGLAAMLLFDGVMRWAAHHPRASGTEFVKLLCFTLLGMAPSIAVVVFLMQCGDGSRESDPIHAPRHTLFRNYGFDYRATRTSHVDPHRLFSLAYLFVLAADMLSRLGIQTEALTWWLWTVVSVAMLLAAALVCALLSAPFSARFSVAAPAIGVASGVSMSLIPTVATALMSMINGRASEHTPHFLFLTPFAALFLAAYGLRYTHRAELLASQLHDTRLDPLADPAAWNTPRLWMFRAVVGLPLLLSATLLWAGVGLGWSVIVGFALRSAWGTPLVHLREALAYGDWFRTPALLTAGAVLVWIVPLLPSSVMLCLAVWSLARSTDEPPPSEQNIPTDQIDRLRGEVAEMSHAAKVSAPRLITSPSSVCDLSLRGVVSPRPMIRVHPLFLGLQPSRQRALLAHELAHHLRGDAKSAHWLFVLMRLSLAGDVTASMLLDSPQLEVDADRVACRAFGVDPDVLADAIRDAEALDQHVRDQSAAGMRAVGRAPDLLTRGLESNAVFRMQRAWWSMFTGKTMFSYWHPVLELRIAHLRRIKDA